LRWFAGSFDAARRKQVRHTAEVIARTMPASRNPRTFETDPAKLDEVQLNRIISIAEAVELSSVSADGWYRHFRHKLIPLTSKRIGVRLRDALFLPD
jgi:hypothetical protein